MKSKKFIKTQLEAISQKYSEIEIRYEYRKSTNSHIIEVIPLSFFEENTDYINDENNLEEKFEKLFPDENIVFISEDSLTEIRNPEWVFYRSYNFSVDNEFFLAGGIILSEDVVITTENNTEAITESSVFTTTNNDSNNNYALAA